MNDTDRALLAEIRERDRQWADEKWRWPAPYRTAMDRRELLRIVGQLTHLFRERDTQAEDRADDAAAGRATAGRWK